MNVDTPAIDVQNVSKSFGTHRVVDRVSLRVQKGEIHGFLGPNGSGKTTFLRMLCGLLTPDEGEGSCLGFDFRRESRRIKKQVGYMPQKFSLYEDLTIAENLDFMARVYAVPNRRQAVRSSLEALGLNQRQNQLAGELSGGWKQRLALAACLISNPRLLLLDEPTAGVDPQARRDFWDEIHQLAGQGLTVLITTHYMDEAERCHRLGYISDGRLLANGTADEVITAARLSTFEISGPNLAPLQRQLGHLPEVALVAAFGSTLHVCGLKDAPLETALQTTISHHHAVKPVPTSLEDVFIHLMRNNPKSAP
jgi:ABC-2 type transport system ATP-binding protein